MHRRIIAARIEAGENPEQRKFKQPDVLARVGEHRPALVAAGLTVLRASEVAGRPGAEMLPQYGSFEVWSARVRGALVWLGEADPCATRERFKLYDPDRASLAAILVALKALAGRAPFRVAELLKKAQNDWEHPIHQSLEGAGLSLDARTIGNYLANNEGKTVDGLHLAGSHDKHAKVRLFQVVEVTS